MHELAVAGWVHLLVVDTMHVGGIFHSFFVVAFN
jgi:hypothetical protein